MSFAEAEFFLEPGLEIATVGFPLGGDALSVYGSLNQVTPFFRAGIVSSVMPFPGRSPQGITIHVPIQGGASGSPVLRTSDGAVIGICAASVLEHCTDLDFNPLPILQNTNLTLVVPGQVADAAAEQAKLRIPFDVNDLPPLSEYLLRPSAS